MILQKVTDYIIGYRWSNFFQGKKVGFATFHCIEETISNFVHTFLVSIFCKEISDDMSSV